MKLNNKGFAITAVLYGLLILFVVLVSSYLLVLSAKKDRIEDLVSGIEKEYNDEISNRSCRNLSDTFEFPYTIPYTGNYTFNITDSSNDTYNCTASLEENDYIELKNNSLQIGSITSSLIEFSEQICNNKNINNNIISINKVEYDCN